MAKDEEMGGILLPPDGISDILKYDEPYRKQIRENAIKALRWFARRWEKPRLIKVEWIWVNPPEDI